MASTTGRQSLSVVISAQETGAPRLNAATAGLSRPPAAAPERSQTSAKKRIFHRPVRVDRGFVPRGLSYACRRPKLFTRDFRTPVGVRNSSRYWKVASIRINISARTSSARNPALAPLPSITRKSVSNIPGVAPEVSGSSCVSHHSRIPVTITCSGPISDTAVTAASAVITAAASSNPATIRNACGAAIH
jgi:hypothetical protein